MVTLKKDLLLKGICAANNGQSIIDANVMTKRLSVVLDESAKKYTSIDEQRKQ